LPSDFFGTRTAFPVFNHRFVFGASHGDTYKCWDVHGHRVRFVKLFEAIKIMIKSFYDAGSGIEQQ
jgi:hypothetical protein